MFSLRKWIAAKITHIPPELGPPSTATSASSSTARSAVLPALNSSTSRRSGSRSQRRNPHSHHCHHQQQSGSADRTSTHPDCGSGGWKTPFDMSASSLLKFYYADDQLNIITAELDSFDGRKDPVRCTNLVNQLRSAQDKVICLLFQLMDEWRCRRADRDYRLKFPDDLVAGGENGESLNGQIWFGAECLASGSNIMNHEAESETLRPMAKLLTNTLEQLRLELRHGVMDIDTSFFIFSHQSRINPGLMQRLQDFDVLFSKFELDYVQAMLPIKTVDEIEKLHELTVLFSEAVAFSLKKELIAQQDVDECNPHVLIAIPRLAIIYGLIHCQESPIFRPQKDLLSKTFSDFHSVLHRVRHLIATLRPIEVDVLERMLTNEDCSSLQNSHYVVHPKPESTSGKSHNLIAISGTGSPPSTTSRTMATAGASSNTSSVQTEEEISGSAKTRSFATRAMGTPASSSTLTSEETSLMHQQNCGPSTSRYSHSYPQRGTANSSFPRPRNQGRPDNSTKNSGRRLRSFRYHRRRHSDPVLGTKREKTAADTDNNCQDMGSTLSLITTMKELRTRTAVMTLEPEGQSNRLCENGDLTPVGVHSVVAEEDSRSEKSGGKAGASPRAVKRETKSETSSAEGHDDDDEERVISSQTSINSSSSCESAVAEETFDVTVASTAADGTAPVSLIISPGTRQLLQRLFVTIAGIADQLQSNSAADLRVILRHVFQMYTVSESDDESDSSPEPNTQTDSDSLSVEEALEAREEALPSSSSSSPTASVPTSPTGSDGCSVTSSDSRSSPSQDSPTNSAVRDLVLETCPDRRLLHLAAGPPHASPATAGAANASSARIRRSGTPVDGNSLPHNSHLTPDDSSSRNPRTLHGSGCPVSRGGPSRHSALHADNRVRVVRRVHRRRIQSEGGETVFHSSAPLSPDPQHMAPIWVPDELVASCSACDQTFTLIRRRHHCRNCGQIYCNNCSGRTLRLGRYGYTKPVRVCDPCFVAVSSLNALQSYGEPADLNSALFHSNSAQPRPSSSFPNHN